MFWVHALSNAGLSPPSPTSAFVLTGSVAPGPPRELRVTEKFQRELSIAWKRPADDGGLLVDCYTLEAVNAEVKSERLRFEFSGTASEGTAHGLQANTNYLLRLRTETAAGTSVAAELLALTGPLPPGVPGLPRLLKESSATSATLAWSAPTKEGGSAVVGYTLQGKALGQDQNGEADVYSTLDVDVPRGTVEGLEPDCAYRFCVCAHNAAGPGPQSDWSPIVRTAPAPPLVPPAPCALSASSQTIELTWAEALDNAASSLQSWEVSVHLADESQQPPLRVVRARRSPVAIRGLDFFTAYRFRVRVRGPGGWSPWSAASEPVETSEEWTDEEIVDHLMCTFGGSLASIFIVFDTNCDGFISELDLSHGLDAAGLDTLPEKRKQALFADLDEGGRGVVTLREFSKHLSRAAASAPSRSLSPRVSFRGDSTPGRSTALARRQGACSTRALSPAGCSGRQLPPPGPGRSLSPPLPSRPLQKTVPASPKRFSRSPSGALLPSPRLQSRERR